MRRRDRGRVQGFQRLAQVLHSADRPVFPVYRKRPGARLCSRPRRFPMDDKTRTELEAAVYRRLVEHLRQRTDVQNIDMMNLAGFCRNCLSNWMKEAADAKGLARSTDEVPQH